MKNKEFEEMVAINKALGGKYDDVIKKLDSKLSFENVLQMEDNHPLYVSPISLKDSRLKGINTSKIKKAFEIKEQCDNPTLSNDIKLWCLTNGASYLLKDGNYFVVAGPINSHYKALFIVNYGNPELKSVLSKWQSLVPPNRKVSFTPTWLASHLEILDSHDKELKTEYLSKTPGKKIQEKLISPVAGTLKIILSGQYKGKNHQEEKTISIQNTAQKIIVTINQPNVLPINVQFNQTWIAQKLELFNKAGASLETFEFNSLKSIDKTIKAPLAGEISIKIFGHNGFNYIEEWTEIQKIESEYKDQDINISIKQPILKPLTISKELNWLVGRIELIQPNSNFLLDRDLIYTDNEEGIINSGSQTSNHLLSNLIPELNITSAVVSKDGFKVRFFAYDPELGFSIPNQFEDTETFNLIHKEQPVSVKWTTKPGAKKDFKKEVKIKVALQVTELIWLNSNGKAFDKVDPIFIDTAGPNRFIKTCEESGTHTIRVIGYKRNHSGLPEIAKEEHKIELEKSDYLEVFLSVDKSADLSGLPTPQPREKGFADYIIKVYTERIDNLITQLRTHKFDQQFLNAGPQDGEKFDIGLVLNLIKEILKAIPATKEAGTALAITIAAAKLIKNAFYAATSNFKQVGNVQSYYNEHIKVLENIKKSITKNNLYKAIVLNEKAAQDDPRRTEISSVINSNDDEQAAKKKIDESIQKISFLSKPKEYEKAIFLGWINKYGVAQGKQEGIWLNYKMRMFKETSKRPWALNKMGDITVATKSNGLENVLIDLDINSIKDDIFNHKIDMLIIWHDEPKKPAEIALGKGRRLVANCTLIYKEGTWELSDFYLQTTITTKHLDKKLFIEHFKKLFDKNIDTYYPYSKITFK